MLRMTKQFKLDAKDKRILAELDKNSRQPFQEIAGKVGLSKEAVFHRIKNLEEKKVIIGYTTLVSLAKLGFIQLKLFIKFQNITHIKKQEIIDYFIKLNTNWVASCVGNYDLIVGFVVSDIFKFHEIYKKILDKYSEYFMLSDFSIMIEGEVYGRKHISEKQHETKHYIGEIEPEKIELKKIDFEILKKLSKNSRSQVVNLAQTLKTTPRVVAYRIKQLEQKKVIQKYTISINHELLGISYFKSLICLRKNNDKILEYLEGQKNSVYNVHVLASWNLEPEFEVYSNNDFYKINDELQKLFGEYIKTINHVLITKECKFELFPI